MQVTRVYGNKADMFVWPNNCLILNLKLAGDASSTRVRERVSRVYMANYLL